MTVRLLAFSGSTRKGSLNQALVDLAAAEARARGAEVTAIRLSDFNLPVYDGDLEAAGFPPAAMELQDLLRAHHGGTRPAGVHPMVSGFRNKVAGIMGASISPFGTLRSLTHLRHILSTIQTVVATEQVMVPFASAAFAEDGSLKDPMAAGLLGAMVARVIDLCERLEPPVS